MHLANDDQSKWKTTRVTVPPTPATTMPPIAETPIAEALPEDSAHITLATKELKIVHINEIDNSNHSGPAMTSTYKRNGVTDIKAQLLVKTRQ